MAFSLPDPFSKSGLGGITGGSSYVGTSGLLDFGSGNDILSKLGLPNPGQDYIDAPIRAAEIAAKQNALGIAEQRRQFDITQKNLQPWLQAGGNALGQLSDLLSVQRRSDLPQFQPMAGSELPAYLQDPGFSYQGPNLPEFQTSAQVSQEPITTPELQQFTNAPQYQSTGQFNFDLQTDPGYQFAIDEAMKAANLTAAGQGKRLSGNLLGDVTRQASGIASQYANDAFNRQLAGSRENYGRNLTDYQTQYGQARDVNAINNALAQAQFGMGTTANDLSRQNALAQFNIEQGTYAPNYQRAQDIYSRALGENQLGYERGLGDYGLQYQRAQDLYNRGTGQYGLEYQRARDVYGQGQNYLDRLAALAGVGQGGANTLGQLGQGTANSIANLLSQTGQAGAAGAMGQQQNISQGLGLLAMLAMA